MTHYDSALESLSEQLQQIDSMLADFARELDDYMEELDFSEQDFAETEERLNLINHLKSKYGDSMEKIRIYAAKQQERLDFLLHLEERKQQLEKEYGKAAQSWKTGVKSSWDPEKGSSRNWKN